MNKIILAAAFTVMGIFTTQAQEISFEKEIHDFGTFDQYGDGAYEFSFTNSGDAPLIISNAKGSCGCTVPVWPKEPIAPGQSHVIKVKYDTKRIGAFNKSVTISSNAITAPTKVIRIKGKTLAVAEEETSPLKTPAGSSPTAK
ncbi:MAG: DUF1573 domain-containing protein [Flavobacteriales bacterium]|nr:DUF1573 domain-containing protein [Flavobacteriales bacterium]